MCDSPRGAHAALEVGTASEPCATHLGRSDLSRAILRSLALDDGAHDASRALALRVLRRRAGESIAVDTDLASARAGALRRRGALGSVELLARTVLERVDTSPDLRRMVLHDAHSVPLAERARALALHGLYDDAALLLTDDTDAGRMASAWRARAAILRVRAGTDTSQELPGVEAVDSDPTSARSERLEAVTAPAPSSPGPAKFLLEATLGADTEPSDHAAALFQALVTFLHTHPAPERAAWIRSIALHPSTSSSLAGGAEAVLMGDPGTPAMRTWLAVRLAEAVSVPSEARVSTDGEQLWIRIGAEVVALRSGDVPGRGDTIPSTAMGIDTSGQLDVLAALPTLAAAVTACVATHAQAHSTADGSIHGSAHRGPPAAHSGATSSTLPVDAAATGRLIADLGVRWSGAPGLHQLTIAAVAARCVTHGPWPDRGTHP